ncbi:receptor activity-modifying protein 2 [Tiliqua scincoides]|uniref:receptor activity-modifying protein 2 n=1 Tax=Tiliqua scincoides TaxID=71010 RepID=UPI003461A62F
MDSQHLPLQLLLLVLTVAHELDAHSGTTVTPWHVNISQAASNKSTLDQEGEKQENTTVASDYEDFAGLCWRIFEHQMASVSSTKWCHWRAIHRPYRNLRYCLEGSADILKYGYPNALAEEYIFFSHRLYFFNCTFEQRLLLDPPENVLLTLILTPICLIPFLVTLVVCKSKGEMQS